LAAKTSVGEVGASGATVADGAAATDAESVGSNAALDVGTAGAAEDGKAALDVSVSSGTSDATSTRGEHPAIAHVLRTIAIATAHRVITFAMVASRSGRGPARRVG
jgi:hypothetical protein